MQPVPFDSKPALNCETGVMSNLLRAQGIEISDNLIFGIGGGLYFIFMPFVKMGDMGPLTSFRYSPGSILKNASKTLNLPLIIKRFSSAKKATEALNAKIDAGEVVGITGDLYYFEIFPEFLNIHFPGHNLIVYGRDDQHYFVSDPIVVDPMAITIENMEKARYFKGPQNPKGKMYWFGDIPNKEFDLTQPIINGIKLTTKRMLNPYFPFGGVKGIRKLAKSVEKYPRVKSPEYIQTHFTNIIRHSEIVGNGGSGYRKQFADFLIEAGAYLNNQTIADLGQEMRGDIAEMWRVISVEMARCGRMKIKESQEAFTTLSKNISKVAELESDLYKRLQKVIK